MRCKVGDLIMVVRDLDFPANNGRLGTVERPCELLGYRGWWVKPVNTFWGNWYSGQNIAGAAEDEVSVGFDDDELRPINNPGEDARDETLSWLDVPSKQGEHA